MIRITILVDNTPGEGLGAEHGFSAYIETPTQTILFDTGQTDLIRKNAQRLDVDLSQTSIVVFSHGHYDHTGGFSYLTDELAGANVLLHPQSFCARYSIREGVARPIGMSESSRKALCFWTPNTIPHLLEDTIGITGYIPRVTAYEDPGGPFFLDEEGRYADAIPDDQALWIQTSKGLVILSGCAHAGIVNTVRYIQEITKTDRLQALIGGFHLEHASPTRLEHTLQALEPFDVLCPCHCTFQTNRLMAAFPNRVIPGKTGLQLEIRP